MIKSPNQSWQPMPGKRLGVFGSPAARHGCTALGSMSLKHSIIAGCLWLGLAACEHAYPPVIVSEYKAPIEISARFSGQDEDKINLAPGGVFVQNRKNLQIEHVTIKEPSGELRTYARSDFDKARAGRKVAFEVWVFSEQGLSLEGQDYLRKRHKQRQ